MRHHTPAPSRTHVRSAASPTSGVAPRRAGFVTAATAAVLAGLIALAGCGVDSSTPRTNEPALVRGRALVAGSSDQSGTTVVLERETLARPAAPAPTPSAPVAAGIEEALAVDHDTTSTDASGWYRFREVSPGRYRITASRGDASPSIAAGVVATADQETIVSDLVLTLVGSIAGHVELAGLTDHSGVVVYVPGVTQPQITEASGAFTLTDVPAGTHTVVAECYGYTVKRSTGVTVTPGTPVNAGVLQLSTDPPSGDDQVAPQVAISSPLSDAVISGTVTVTVTASDEVGVQNVILFLNKGDGLLYPAVMTTSPYSYELDVAALGSGVESVRLYADAFDAAGNVARSIEVVCPLTCRYGDLPELAGILETNDTGQVIGGDTNDWCPNESPPGSNPALPYLDPAYPNPSADAVTIYFGVSSLSTVDYLVIVDQHCRTIRTLLDGQAFSIGNYPVFWDLTDEQNQRVAPGIYRAIIKIGDVLSCYGDIQVNAPTP